MKIALISGAHPYSGLGKYALSLFERLHSLDRNVDMLHCETPGAYLQLNHNRVKILRERFRWPYIGRTFLPMHYYFSGQIPGGYDIYHISHIGLSKVAKLRKPSVITHMDIAQFLFPQMYSFPERVWIKMLLKYYREADRIIAISESSRDELLGLGIVPSEKVTVVHLGYDEKLYKPLPKQEARQKLGLPREAKIVLNVGTEDARKDIPTLLKAVYNLQQTIPNLMLIRVGGTNPANDAIKKQIMLRQYQNIPEAELPLLYSAGKTSCSFLKIPVGVRNVGMGEVGTASLDINSIYYNPSGLGWLTKPELTFSHNQHFQDIHYEHIAGETQIKDYGTFGLSLYLLGMDKLQGYDAKGVATDKIGAYDTAVALSYGRYILGDRLEGSGLSIGGSLKFIRREEEKSISDFAIDLGAVNRISEKGLSIGLSLQNIGEEWNNFGFLSGVSKNLLGPRLLVSVFSVIPAEGRFYAKVVDTAELMPTPFYHLKGFTPYPLTIFSIALFMFIGDTSYSSAKVMALFAGLLLVSLIYQLSKELFFLMNSSELNTKFNKIRFRFF